MCAASYCFPPSTFFPLSIPPRFFLIPLSLVLHFFLTAVSPGSLYSSNKLVKCLLLPYRTTGRKCHPPSGVCVSVCLRSLVRRKLYLDKYAEFDTSVFATLLLHLLFFLFFFLLLLLLLFLLLFLLLLSPFLILLFLDHSIPSLSFPFPSFCPPPPIYSPPLSPPRILALLEHFLLLPLRRGCPKRVTKVTTLIVVYHFKELVTSNFTQT